VFGAGSVWAAIPGPGWAIDSIALPTNFSASENSACEQSGGSHQQLCDAYQVTTTNAGSKPTEGTTTVTETLPAGLKLREVAFYWTAGGPNNLNFFCETEGSTARCQFPEALAPDETLQLVVHVTVEPGAPANLTSTASVSGGGAAQATAVVHNENSSLVLPFGFVSFGASIVGLDGAPGVQAGGHPYELTTRIDLHNVLKITPEGEPGVRRGHTGVEDVKDLVVDLPLGFLGSALATPTCALSQLASGACPADTRIGHILSEPSDSTEVNEQLYNMVPEHGVAAEFGYLDNVGHGTHVIYSGVAPSAAGYVLRATTADVPQIPLTNIVVNFYGNPVERDGNLTTPMAFFTNPADCSGQPLMTAIHMDSWQHPGRVGADGAPDFSDPSWVGTTSESPPVRGCNELRFAPSLGVQPETMAASTQTGLNVDLKVPQNKEPGTLATPPLRDARVTLPAGLVLNPAAAGGLGACSEAQIGWLGRSLSDFTAGAPSCPVSSRVGTVELSTPLVGGVLQGSIYLATQNENPFHSLLAGYIVVDDPATGVLVKIAGNLTPDASTGQITGVFDENPQLPFSELRLHFFGGARGELVTPTGCGTYTTMSDLMPWSAPDSGPDAAPLDSFSIASGCTPGFAPGLIAGTADPQAGGYSPFMLSLSRSDGEQDLSGLTVSLPRGLLGKIAGIPLCPDAQANAGTCPEASRVGSVQAGAGVGPDPYFVGGSAYLTGPYKGGPYGLVVEVPAIAGPFDLGVVVVRQSLRIDPHTTQVTAVSDPFPRILQGIPLRIRRVDVTLDRPGFTFNPTSCTPMAVTGTVTSTEGASASVSSRFQAGGCRELPFAPKFTVSTQARTSKKNGASLDVIVGSGPGQANIGRVAVTLPKALPSRLSTIQQACPEAAFAANPATCPAGSDIGTATAHTPVLASPLMGPAYLVSHGGAAFPDLVLILQGEGVTLDLVGSIDIKKQITSSTFASVPDAPISSFELSLPEGSHSALAAVLPAKAKGNLCGTSLVMPTTITGQNGAQIQQNTRIAVTGCAKAKKAKRKHGRGRMVRGGSVGRGGSGRGKRK
jgi:hypothetical protein